MIRCCRAQGKGKRSESKNKRICPRADIKIGLSPARQAILVSIKYNLKYIWGTPCTYIKLSCLSCIYPSILLS